MYSIALKLSIIAGFITGSLQVPASDHVKRDSPVLPGYNADPNIAVFGDTYYIYPTADGQNWEGTSFYVWKSQNLVDWTRSEEPVLTLDGTRGFGHSPWATGNAWAPTIIEREGTYYFYYSGWNLNVRQINIGVAVGRSPEGPFAGAPEPMIIGNEHESLQGVEIIDPMAFRDPDTGKYWLYWGNGRSMRAQLNKDMLTINWNTLGENTGLDEYLEAPFVVWRQGAFHMTWSISDTRSEDYRVGYATAPTAKGPWESRGVILKKDVEKGILGTGHQSIVNAPGTDDWYIVYHRFAIPDGDGYHRETTIDRLNFDPQTGLIKPVKPTLKGISRRPSE